MESITRPTAPSKRPIEGAYSPYSQREQALETRTRQLETTITDLREDARRYRVALQALASYPCWQKFEFDLAGDCGVCVACAARRFAEVPGDA